MPVLVWGGCGLHRLYAVSVRARWCRSQWRPIGAGQLLLTLSAVSRNIDAMSEGSGLSRLEMGPAADAAGNADPAVGLRAVRALQRLQERLGAIHVAHAREQGWSWQAIANTLGVSRQAV